ncbi:hypothetical protein [Streptomyces shenzhenensis]|uniref:hypothetical protein n=1 Tax=Streptomyces shenzhenensis TaxID=943815 RepID=UPI001F2E384D|nr:hypothetical protein [Streptomyces shenzhenensis]
MVAALVLATCGITWGVVHLTRTNTVTVGAAKAGNEVDPAVAKKELKARVSPLTPVVVRTPGGYEAACYDEHGHITFWRRTASGWRELAQSVYPKDVADGPGSYDEHGVSVQGATPSGSADAVFIVNGPFTGDGSGNAVAFGNGPDGWGLLLPRKTGQLVSSGSGSSSINPGIYLSERFTQGMLETDENTGVFSTAFGAGFPLRRYWYGTKDRLVEKRDNIVTATTASAPQGTVPALPSAAPPDGTYGGLLVDATVADGHVQPGTDPQIKLTVQSSPVSPACAKTGSCRPSGEAGTTSVTAPADATTVYPVTADGRDASITGPLWPLTGLADSLWGEDSSTEISSPYTDPGYYKDRGNSPWHIPAALHATAFTVTRSEAVELTFRHGGLVDVRQLAPHGLKRRAYGRRRPGLRPGRGRNHHADHKAET